VLGDQLDAVVQLPLVAVLHEIAVCPKQATPAPAKAAPNANQDRILAKPDPGWNGTLRLITAGEEIQNFQREQVICN
jgi:hypothetical protein